MDYQAIAEKICVVIAWDGALAPNGDRVVALFKLQLVEMFFVFAPTSAQSFVLASTGGQYMLQFPLVNINLLMTSIMKWKNVGID